MARPIRCRRVCAEPSCRGFTPQSENNAEEITLTVDEYEVIRLIDHEKQTQAQCALQMKVARTTVTEIYERARFKLADSLVNGKALCISGGNYRVCRGDREYGCGRNCRWKSGTGQNGGTIMRIAVAYENGSVFQHFGHTQQMELYDVDDGQITARQVVDTTGSGHGALAGFLSDRKVDTLICGGIGAGAQEALAQAGIRLYGGVTGSAEEAVKALLAGELRYNADVRCDRHGHGHGHHGHDGHDHHCGENKHGCAGNGPCGENKHGCTGNGHCGGAE